jgi:diguanylate cyclase (GGDEF)-like protein/PAS domain S-box-containing protein
MEDAARQQQEVAPPAPRKPWPPRVVAIARLLALVLLTQAAALVLSEIFFDDVEGWHEEAVDIALASLLLLPALIWLVRRNHGGSAWSVAPRLALIVALAQAVAMGFSFVFEPEGVSQLAEELVDLAVSGLVTAPLLWLAIGPGEFGVPEDDVNQRLGTGDSPHRRLRWSSHGTLAALGLLFGVSFWLATRGDAERDAETAAIYEAAAQLDAWQLVDKLVVGGDRSAIDSGLSLVLDGAATLEPRMARLVAEQGDGHHGPEDRAALMAWQADAAQWRAAHRTGNHLRAIDAPGRLQRSLEVNRTLVTTLRKMRDEHADETVEALGRMAVLGMALLLALSLAVVEPMARRERDVHRRLSRQSADFERLAIVAETTSNAVLILDREGRLLWANVALQRLTGRPLSQTLGEPAVDALAPDEEARVDWHLLLAQLAAGHSARRTLPCHHADGSRVWVDADLQPRWGENGAIEGVIVVAADVTLLTTQRERLRALLDTLPAGVVELDEHGRVSNANRAAQRILARPMAQLRSQTLTGESWRWVGEDLKLSATDKLPTERTLREGLSLHGFNLGVGTPTGDTRWLLMNTEPMAGGGVLACFVDMTDQRTQRTMLRVALDTNGIGTWDWRLDSGDWEWSDNACRQVGFSRAEFEPLLANWRERIHPEDKPRVRALLRAHYDDPQAVPFDTELRILHREGHWVWVHVCGAVVERTGAGRAKRMVGIHVDISARMEQAEQSRVASLTDSLTKLHNRAALVQRLRVAIEQREADPSKHFALLFLDLDRFKQINDTLGHTAGDEMLRVVAQRLRTELRPADELARFESEVTAARLGGDEFVIALRGLRSPGDAGSVAERVLRALGQPCRLLGREVPMSVSIGVVTSEWGHQDPADLLRDADIAMYEAKRAGRGRWVRFEPWMGEAIEHRSELEADLRQALAKGQITVEYQPIMDLSASPTRCVMLEALARWNSPGRGNVPPVQFIPVAEDCGLIHELGRQVLDRACADFMALRARLGEAAPAVVSVNASVAQLHEAGFVQQVDATLKRHKMPASCLQIEITESMAAQEEAVMRRLQALKAMGVKLALDDFGTGYSSLSCLHQMPIDTVKIDRGFIHDLDHSTYHRTLVEATVRVAHTLRIACVAEGVETPAQLSVLAAMDCDAVQGYLFSRPLDVAQIGNWLAHWQDRVAESLSDPVTVPGLEFESPPRRRLLN